VTEGTHWTPTGVATFRTRETRPRWAPPCTPTTTVFPQPKSPLPADACRPATAGCCHPAGTSHHKASRNEASSGVQPFARPVFPSPVAPGMERESLGLNPELRTPPLPATHVRTGTGHGTQAGATPDMTSTSKLCISLAMFDLVSHGQPRVSKGLSPSSGGHTPPPHASSTSARKINKVCATERLRLGNIGALVRVRRHVASHAFALGRCRSHTHPARVVPTVELPNDWRCLVPALPAALVESFSTAEADWLFVEAGAKPPARPRG
jgi:hypothetical protein